MEQVLRMFVYLKGHTNPEMVFDPGKVEFVRADFLGRIGATQSTPQMTVS